jgi:hypothetical protein
MSTSGSRIGTSPWSAICSATSNCCRAFEQRVEPVDRLHEADAVGFRLQSLIDFEKGYDAAIFPEIGGHGLAVDVAVHRSLEQDRGDHFIARERRRRHDAHAHLVHEAEHLDVAAVRGVGDAVRAQGSGRRTAALVEGGEKARLAGDLLTHSCCGHGSLLQKARMRAYWPYAVVAPFPRSSGASDAAVRY